MNASYAADKGDRSLLASVQLWMSRLQLVAAVSAFFASTDGLLLGRVGTYDPTDTSVGNTLTQTTLAGALALHTSAAIISYLASFVLVKYNRISVPISEEAEIGFPKREATRTTAGESAENTQSNNPIRLQSFGQNSFTATLHPMITIERVYLRNLFQKRSAATSTSGTITEPELQDAHDVLVRCESLCVTLAFVGLVLALIGIMTYVWTAFALAPAIFVSVCLLVSLTGACYTLR